MSPIVLGLQIDQLPQRGVAVGVSQADDVAGVLDHRALQTQADAEVGNLAFAGEADAIQYGPTRGHAIYHRFLHVRWRKRDLQASEFFAVDVGLPDDLPSARKAQSCHDQGNSNVGQPGPGAEYAKGGE